MRTLVIAAAVLLSFTVRAQTPNFDAVQIKTLKVAQNIYMLEGMGGNIALSVGEDGVLMVDDQFAPLSAKILDAIKAITDKPVRFLVNTHYHWDHTGGNENIGKLGALIVAHDNVYKRMASNQVVTLLKQSLPPYPKVALPVITFSDRVTYHINGDDIVVLHVPPSHTDGDSFVRFQDANVVHTGDVFASGRYPFIDVENHGSVMGIVKAMDMLIPTLDEFTKVIPGHGPVSTRKEVIAYRHMIYTIGTRVQKLVKQGKTLEQVIAAKPAAEFDAEWGKFRKTDDFIPFVYYGFAPMKK
ncbi:MAG TPA: MBL fold metallo-hydrolase [Burkholderiales bacterium]|nr:MBL fold metallo-hydrolase [Burkholderiales bacterium]